MTPTPDNHTAAMWVRDRDLAGLPGWPVTRQAATRKAKRIGLSRRRADGQGGGYEYDARSLDPPALAALILKRANEEHQRGAGPTQARPAESTAADAAGAPPLALVDTDSRDPNNSSSAPAGKPTTSPAGAPFSADREMERRGALWDWADRQTGKKKDEGMRRMGILMAIEKLRDQGVKVCAAVDTAASEAGVHPSTIRRWMRAVSGEPMDNWYPLVIPRQRGGGRFADIDARAWDYFKSDYLRLSGPAASACYERMLRVAEDEGWPQQPHVRTFMRRLEAEVAPQAIILARKGRNALMRSYPAQERDRTAMHAMQAVNADGHIFDVAVRWPDGVYARPVLLAFQDICSGRPLSYAVDRTENKDLVRIAFGSMVDKYGVPLETVFDNGRGFAAKCLTGGSTTRNRFKIKDEDPIGIINALGVRIHWATPYHGQAKPIERMFGDLCCERIAKHPACAGAYLGNNPLAKPEDYGSRAMELDEFLSLIEAEWVAFCARTGRRSNVCTGRSLDEVFFESYKTIAPRRVTEEQRRLFLLANESVRTSRETGEFRLFGNRYWTEAMTKHKSERVIVRFDQDLHDKVYVYDLANRLICDADCIAPTGFFDAAAAAEHARAKAHYGRKAKQLLKAEKRLSAATLAGMLPAPKPEPEVPVSAVVGGVFGDAGRELQDDLSPRDKAFIDAVEKMERDFNPGEKIS